MTALDKNRVLAGRLGWSPSDFMASAFDDNLVFKITERQKQLGVAADGICGRATYLALLKSFTIPVGAGLVSAGRLVLATAKIAWLQNIEDLPPRTSPDRARCKAFIDKLVRTYEGISWTWEDPYDGNFEWCGTLAAHGWSKVGVSVFNRRNFFASTYRLDRWARYYQAVGGTPNPKPAVGPFRQIKELDENSRPEDARFGPEDPPRAGDILLVGGQNTAYGKHITVVESYDENSGVFVTIEGNGTGQWPDGSRRHGVVRAARRVGLLPGTHPTTYHARRLIRPAQSDLWSA